MTMISSITKDMARCMTECDVFAEIVADRLPILVQSEEEQSRLLGRVRRWKCLYCRISFVSRSPTMEDICDFAILWQYREKLFTVVAILEKNVFHRCIGLFIRGSGLFSKQMFQHWWYLCLLLPLYLPVLFINILRNIFRFSLSLLVCILDRSYRLSGRSYRHVRLQLIRIDAINFQISHRVRFSRMYGRYGKNSGGGSFADATLSEFLENDKLNVFLNTSNVTPCIVRSCRLSVSEAFQSYLPRPNSIRRIGKTFLPPFRREAEGFQLDNRRPKRMNRSSIRIQLLSFLATVQSSDSTFLAGFIAVKRC